MIKWGSYLKLFVLSLFTLLISCFTFWVNFSDSAYVRQIGSYWYNPYSQSVNINITRNWGFLSETAGYTKAIFVLNDWNNNKSYFWRTNNWIPYYYGYWSYLGSANYYYLKNEGYLKNYFTCSEIIAESNSLPSNCVEHSVSDSTPYVFANFLSEVSNSDYFAFNINPQHSYSNNNWYRNDILCISSSSLGSSICFYAWVQRWYEGVSDSYARYVWYFNGANFDLGSNLDWLSISSSLLKNPPNINSVSWDSVIDSSTWVNATLTWNLVYSDNTCTYKELIDYMENSFWFNKYLCYWWLNNWDYFDSSLTYSPIPWTWKTLSEILIHSAGAWDTPRDWYYFWNWLYFERDKYTAMWESYPAVMRTWFDLYHQYWGYDLDFDSVREYCIMIGLDIDFANTIYNWTPFRDVCKSIKSFGSAFWGWFSPWWGAWWGGSSIAVDWNWIWDLWNKNSSWMTITQDWKTFISNFFNKVKSSIIVPDKSDFWLWILPSYIIWAFLGIIFFNFLRK